MGYLQLLEALGMHRRRQRERAAAIRDLIEQRRLRAQGPVPADVRVVAPSRVVSRAAREWRR
jgi:hypothetical protein